MNIAEKLNTLIRAAAANITTDNEFADGCNYQTDIGNALDYWLGKDVDDNEDGDLAETERLEIREVEGDPTDEQYPLGRDRTTFEFAYYKVMEQGDVTASVNPETILRKVQTDIYRMIGSNLAGFRSGVNAGLYFTRGKWTRNVQLLEKVYMETSIEIIVEYPTTDVWQLEEEEYS